ncbi:unnamed protein product [Brassica napus]|uniref:(rape) hypothetical protein n=1 Tax=Brassica napus TaxID=3708 RepID=A0A816TVP2_BRANA|nr:unnamed protein product [Brassica napus]
MVFHDFVLCVLLFSLLVEKFIFIHSEWDDNHFFQFVVTISDMVFMVMVDDNTRQIFVLKPDSSGKELILIALLWKQSPWKPPWKKYIKDGEVQNDEHSHNHN